ncbi:MAG: hypothetical protein J2P23_08730 [Microlunatus sp.]|nr:hypothetical protein [Microlunatus sp.]
MRMRSRADRRRGERGSGPITALLVMGFLALMMAAWLAGLGGAASAEGAKAQDAADAAALAGAGYILDDLPNELLSAPFSDPATLQGPIGEPGCVQLGRASAADLAGHNSAKLTDYCWWAGRTEVTASVELDYSTVKGQPARAEAVAAPGFSLSQCTIDPNFVPPSDPPRGGKGGNAQGGGGKNKPAPPVDTTLNCGFGDLSISYDPATKLFTFTDPAQLRSVLAGLKPRLVR